MLWAAFIRLIGSIAEKTMALITWCIDHWKVVLPIILGVLFTWYAYSYITGITDARDKAIAERIAAVAEVDQLKSDIKLWESAYDTLAKSAQAQNAAIEEWKATATKAKARAAEAEAKVIANSKRKQPFIDAAKWRLINPDAKTCSEAVSEARKDLESQF